MKRAFGKWFLPLGALAMLTFAVIHVVRASQQPPAASPAAEPPRTPFGRTISGSGVVEAQTENIAVGSALSGVVLEVYVPVDQAGLWVKAGTPLFRVDDRHLKAQLAYQEANLAAAEAQLAKLEAQPRPEEVPVSEAKVRAADANTRMLLDQHERAHRLLSTRAIAAEEQVQKQLLYEVGRQQLAQAKADFDLLMAGAWKYDKDIARAAVALAGSQLAQTKTEIERALVCAPVDGEVLKVNVRPGEYVGTQQAQALVVLGNSRRLHVRVDIDENDIPRFRPGRPATASPRGDSRITYPLAFVRVEPFVVPKRSLTGDNTERVDTRVLQVIYALEATEPPVFVGQLFDVFINREDASP